MALHPQLSLHLMLMQVTHEILVVDTPGWTSIAQFRTRWRARTGFDFVPTAFGYACMQCFLEVLERYAMIYVLPNRRGFGETTLLCPRGALCALVEPAQDIQTAARRFQAGRHAEQLLR